MWTLTCGLCRTALDLCRKTSGLNARVVVVGFRRWSGGRTATYLPVSITFCSNAHTVREAALTATVTSRRDGGSGECGVVGQRRSGGGVLPHVRFRSATTARDGAPQTGASGATAGTSAWRCATRRRRRSRSRYWRRRRRGVGRAPCLLATDATKAVASRSREPERGCSTICGRACAAASFFTHNRRTRTRTEIAARCSPPVACAQSSLSPRRDPTKTPTRDRSKPNTVPRRPQPQPTEARPSRARPQRARGLRPSRSPCTRWPWRPC